MACCFIASYCIGQLVKACHFLDLDEGILYNEDKNLEALPSAPADFSTRDSHVSKPTSAALILSLGGLTCAACTSAVEDAVSRLPGVDKVRISLPLQQATVVTNGGIVDESLILETVRNVGYDAQLGPRTPKQVVELLQAKEEITRLRHSFSHLGRYAVVLQSTAWLASTMASSSLSTQGFLRLLSVFSLFVTLYTQCFHVSRIHADGWRGLRSGHVNMNTLSSLSMGLGSLLALTELLFGSTGESNAYCTTTAGLALVVVAGRYLDALSRRSASKYLNGTYKPLLETQYAMLHPSRQLVPSTYLRPSDEIVVEAYTAIPCDCYVLEGTSLVNQAMITGESLPVRKTVGNCLFGGTRNLNKRLVCAVQKPKEDSFFAHLVQRATDSTSAGSGEYDFLDIAMRYFVTCVMILALAVPTLRLHRLWNISKPYEMFRLFVSRAITILTSACPCALGLAMPSAVIALVSAAGKRGILVTGGVGTIRRLQSSRTIVFDKTGTLTEATLAVEDIVVASQWASQKEVLWQYVCAVEEHAIAIHPVARAIFSSGVRELGPSWLEKHHARKCESLTSDTGLGVSGSVFFETGPWRRVMVGSSRYLGQSGIKGVPEKAQLSTRAMIPVHVAVDAEYAGSLYLGDSVREEAADVIQRLSSMGYECGMLTGDTKEAALRVSKILNLPILGSQAMPADKLECIKSLQRSGSFVTMVGDGMNDVPSLSIADVGVGLHRDSAPAVMGTSITILNSKLDSVGLLYRMADLTMQQMHFNLLFNFAYNAITLVFASGLMQPFGLDLTPLQAAVLMSMSSIFITWQSFRLRARLEQ